MLDSVEISNCGEAGISLADLDIMLKMNNSDIIYANQGILGNKKNILRISTSTISDCDSLGVRFLGPDGGVESSYFYNNGIGILADGQSKPWIKESNLINNRTGIYAGYKSKPHIRHTRIIGGDYGVNITSDAKPDIGTAVGQAAGFNEIYGSKWYVYNNTQNKIFARVNYWGTMEVDTIKAHIWDKQDNSSLGEVVFQPIWEGPVASGGAMSGGEIELMPKVFKLYQNSPNPFADKTTIRYAVPKKAEVLLKIYDVSGRCIKILANGKKEPGYYKVDLEAKDFGAGIYFAKFEAGNYKEVKKLILMR